jgi:hypothetical protein
MYAETIQPQRKRKNWEDAAAAAQKTHERNAKRRAEARANAEASDSRQMKRALSLALKGYGAEQVAQLSMIPLKLAYLLVTGEDK